MAVDCNNLSSVRGGTVDKPCKRDASLFSMPGSCTIETARAWRKLARDLYEAVPDSAPQKATLAGRLVTLDLSYDLREVGIGGDKQLAANPFKLREAAVKFARLAKDCCRLVPPDEMPPDAMEFVPLLDDVGGGAGVAAGLGALGLIAGGVLVFLVMKELK